MNKATPSTRHQVEEAIDRIRPVVEQQRDDAERNRQVSDSVIEAMQEEGFFRLWLPKEYGGVELDLPIFLEAIEELSRIDSAAGWTLANQGTSAVLAAFLPETGASEVVAGGALSAGTIAPRGHAVPEDGGYRVTGRWPFASGCRHSAWLGGNCLVFEGEAPRTGPGNMPDFTFMFFPISDCTILDTWNPTGMRGTDSTDFIVENVFVPAHRTFSLFTAQSRLPGALYKMGIDVLFFTALSTVGLGIARASIDAFVELAKAKTPTLSQTGLAARPTIHAEVAKAEATYQAARAYLHEVARAMMDSVETGNGLPEAVEARRRLACLHVADSSARVVDMMYRLGGTTSIQAGGQLDRCLRDIHTVNQHLAVSPVWWEKTGQSYFGLGLGMP